VRVEGGQKDILLTEGITKILKTANGNIVAKSGEAKYELSAYESEPEILATLGSCEQ
jgi:hypothetical protein